MNDALDAELLAVFGEYFPRPGTLPFCDYDIDPSDVEQLCATFGPVDPVLLRRFACHNRWGMFGDHSHFPAFAGQVAVHLRRDTLLFDHDLAFILHNTHPGRPFWVPRIREVLEDWVLDVLHPWRLPDVPRTRPEGMQVLSLLALAHQLGIDLQTVGDDHRARARETEADTVLSAAFDDLTLAGSTLEVRFTVHFEELERCWDNQRIDGRFVEPATVAALWHWIQEVREPLQLARYGF